MNDLMPKDTHMRHVKERLLKYGYITSWDAIVEHHNTRIGQYIHILRRRGWNIETQMEQNKETKTPYARYILVAFPEEVLNGDI